MNTVKQNRPGRAGAVDISVYAISLLPRLSLDNNDID